MTTKKYLLIGAAVAAIAGLTGAGEVLADGSPPPPPCTVTACNLNPAVPQVQCGTYNSCPICVDILPVATPIGTGDSCKFDWNIYIQQSPSTISKTAIAYECTPGIRATGANGAACGAGSGSAVGNAFKGIFQLDSVNSTVTAGKISYQINSACAQRGPNDVMVKPASDSVKTCNGPIEGFGSTNTFATTTGCQEQDLGDSGCRIKTCFVRGTGNNIISYEITALNENCTVGAQQPLGGGLNINGLGVTDIPDGTIMKFGTSSCYQVTYQRKTTWVATAPTTVCPPTT